MDTSKSQTKVAILGGKHEIENGQERSAYFFYNYLLPALKLKGYEAVFIDWRTQDYAFNEAKHLIIGPVWDYSQHVSEFRSLLDRLITDNMKAINPLPFIRWNLNKNYLLELRTTFELPITEMVEDEFDTRYDIAISSLKQ